MWESALYIVQHGIVLISICMHKGEDNKHRLLYILCVCFCIRPDILYHTWRVYVLLLHKL